jgi:hypothetical protein
MIRRACALARGVSAPGNQPADDPMERGLLAASGALSPTEGLLELTFGESADGRLPSPDIGGLDSLDLPRLSRLMSGAIYRLTAADEAASAVATAASPTFALDRPK